MSVNKHNLNKKYIFINFIYNEYSENVTYLLKFVCSLLLVLTNRKPNIMKFSMTGNFYLNEKKMQYAGLLFRLLARSNQNKSTL